MSSWRKISIVILIALLALCAFLAITSASTTSYSAESVAKDYNIPIGQSMFENQSIVGTTSENVEVPLVANVGFLTHQLMAFDLQGILRGVTTGIVPFDFSVVSGEGIDSYGKVVDVVGPGYLTYEGDKLAVKAPDNYVWGYSAPYKWLEKTESGVDVYENGTKIKSVPVDEIRNLDYHNDYYNASTIASWYNYDAQVGSTFTLEKGMVGFSDGRNNISSSDVPKIFGQAVVDYAAEYPTGSPILLYSGNYTNETGEVYKQNECLANVEIKKCLNLDKPEAIVVLNSVDLWVIECKRSKTMIDVALDEAKNQYAKAINTSDKIKCKILIFC